MSQPDTTSGRPVFRPGPGEWMALAVRDQFGTRQQTMRRELGLPDDRPVLMSGHHCEFWHPGILAKWFALQICAHVLEGITTKGAATAWIEVDQDSNAAWQIAYPSAGPARAVWRMPFAAHSNPSPDTPTASLGPVQVAEPDVKALDPAPGYEFAREGLRGIAGALALHQSAPTLAVQVTLARNDLLAWTGPTPTSVHASSLARTTLFGELLERMAGDPRGCVDMLNNAAAAFPEARVRPLEVHGGRTELPLWRLQPGTPRRRVYADELASIPREALAPRALLMTALLRAGACDLFVHGLGGERYDRATDRWIGEWLGWELAPTVMITATRYLPFGVPDVPSPEAIARARWEAWHARTDPGMLGDADAAAQKLDLVRTIELSRDRSGRAALFKDLHALAQAARTGHSARLAELESRAQALRREADIAGVVFDRTWAFPLYPRDAMVSLRDEILGAFSGSEAPSPARPLS